MAHGKGVVEIKCPATIPQRESPNPPNYKHQINDAISKRSSEYCQIQGQMAVTQRIYAGFFVFIINSGFGLLWNL